jgi:Zinc knuckle
MDAKWKKTSKERSMHKGAMKDNKNITCYGCGKKGHFKSECRSIVTSQDRVKKYESNVAHKQLQIGR